MKKRLFRILPLLLAVIISICMLTACVDADFEVQRVKMTGLGYVEHNVTGEYGSCDAAYRYVILYEKGTIKDEVYLLYFATDYYAIVYERDVFLGYSLPRLQEGDPEVGETIVYQRVGKIFIFGTEQGLKDALS